MEFRTLIFVYAYKNIIEPDETDTVLTSKQKFSVYFGGTYDETGHVTFTM